MYLGRVKQTIYPDYEKIKISRTVKINLLLKIKQVKFFSGYAVATGTSVMKYIIFFLSKLLPSSVYSKLKTFHMMKTQRLSPPPA